MWKGNWLSNTILEKLKEFRSNIWVVSEGKTKQEVMMSIIVFHALVHTQLNK